MGDGKFVNLGDGGYPSKHTIHVQRGAVFENREGRQVWITSAGDGVCYDVRDPLGVWYRGQYDTSIQNFCAWLEKQGMAYVGDQT